MYESRNNSVPRSLQQLQYLKQYHIMDITNDKQLIANYLDILNQETDVYYLFDSFHSLLNSVKQAEESKITNKPRQNTIDWWKLTNQSQSWAGLKNIKGISNTPSKIRVTNDSSHARQIGQVELQVFSEKDLENNKQERTLLSVYQLQNKYYKCHMGFCQLQKQEGQMVQKGGQLFRIDTRIYQIYLKCLVGIESEDQNQFKLRITNQISLIIRIQIILNYSINK
ncbi:unnamed protein product [Paramecium pentaurelia]|uniref:Uncharacterized protein n=1 Tax=Paramecium pentaurelia TaxID=43138 RepID=A0A8S1W4E3_9CILI|nr:unnamed protein product [Paramecium pentaurelia]